MRKTIISVVTCIMGIATQGFAQSSGFTNFIRQVQFPGGIIWDMSVLPAGTRLSALPIDPGGARFELWTVNGARNLDFLLDSTYVGTYIPVANLEIITEDTSSVEKRTRADRPFSVRYSVSGLKDDILAPDAARSVNLLWHTQSYGTDGTGDNIDRDQATLMASVSIDQNGENTFSFVMSSIPSTDLAKIRGEERFSIYSLPDYQAPSSQLAGDTIKIWPMSDGSISGIQSGELIRYTLPTLTLQMNDLYPTSSTYARAYPGGVSDNPVNPKLLPGSHVNIDQPHPESRTLTVDNYGDAFGADGTWTVELVTETIFDTRRLDYVTFSLDRTMKVNATLSTIE